MLAAEILLPLPLPAFSFLVPYGSEAGPVGGRVVVPWQGGLRIGLCTGLSDARLDDGLRLRELICWLDADEPFFADAAVPLFAELAEAARLPAGAILAAFSATGFHGELDHGIMIEGGAPGSPEAETGTWIPAATVSGDRLEELRQAGLVRERAALRPRTVRQLAAATTGTDGLPAGKRTANQLRALELLLEGPAASAAALARDAGVPGSAARALVKRGLAEYRELPAPPAIPELPAAETPLPAAAFSVPEQGSFQLFGGLRRSRLAELVPLLKKETAAGRSPLLLAPEQGILKEAASWLRGHVPLLVFSGELKDEEREYVRGQAAATAGTVLAGTYPALFLRQRNPGSIIVLEAASDSWKLQSGARLFIPDAARLMAELQERRLVQTGIFQTAELKAADLPVLRLPSPRQRLHVTDLNSASSWPLDADLIRVLRQVRDRGRQAVILASRRGFSAALVCLECGLTVGCPNCDLPLRYHQRENRLRCHQCNHGEAVPARCPSCGGRELQPSRTAGTEWLQERIRELLPGFPVLRHDADSRQLPEALLAGEPGVLVATVAALRLPPLPGVSLIAVTMFDGHVSLGDFRAGENMLGLLLALPELTLKERPLVIVQTFRPGDPVLEVLRADDAERALLEFTRRTAERREAFGYPPAGRLARVEVSARDRAAARSGAERLRGALLTAGAAEEDVLGPVPSGVARVRGRYVWQLLLRSRTEERFRQLLDSVPAGRSGVRIAVDVDPRGAGLLLE